VLHVLNNSLAKGLLFLSVGSAALASGAASVPTEGGGLLRRLPVSGLLMLVGLFAITGSPPFGMFVSLYTIVHSAFAQGHVRIALLVLFLLAVLFVGIARLLLELLLGRRVEPAGVERKREVPLLVVGPAVLAVLVLFLGLYIPQALHEALGAAAAALGGTAP
jgi:hydrogenase-4 component F